MFKIFDEKSAANGESYDSDLLEIERKKIKNFQQDVELNKLDVNAPLNPPDKECLLHLIASYGTVEQMEWLVAKNANFHLVDEAGYSALHCAVKHDNLAVVKFILEKNKIPIDIAAIENKTPLFIAIDENNEVIARLLVEKGANINVLYECGKHISLTFLEVFLGNCIPNSDPIKNLKSAELLLKLKVQITPKAIKYAIRADNLEGIKLLHRYEVAFTTESLEFAKSNEEKWKHYLEASKQSGIQKKIALHSRMYNIHRELRIMIESSLEQSPYHNAKFH